MHKQVLIPFVIAAAWAGSALASPSRPVRIEVKTVLAGVHPGTFTTSGAPLCRRGSSRDRILVPFRHAGGRWSFRFRKTFACADGSGTFAVDESGQLLDGASRWHGRWTIVAGTGAYSKLHGAGTVAGDELPGRVDDHMTGSVSLG
ncbi:MAG TPA: hypothetical protein VFA66_06955 [Gaiellaceae bacterium]|nr:hypothetical protein [Gaiellaceae bacterium]